MGVTQQSAESLATINHSLLAANFFRGFDPLVCQALMVSFLVITCKDEKQQVPGLKQEAHWRPIECVEFVRLLTMPARQLVGQ